MPAVIASVYKNLLNSEKWGEAFSNELGDDLLKIMIASPPRIVRQMLESAICNASFNGRTYLIEDDLKKVQHHRKMGF